MVMMILTGPIQENDRWNHNRNIPFLNVLIPCLLYAFVFGCRYNVGTDYMNYLYMYQWGIDRDLEFGFSFLQSLFKELHLHFAWFFGFLAFIQISLYSTAIKDRKLYPWFFLVFILSCRWLILSNGIRQAVAACIFVYSVQFIVSKKVLPYLICIVLACSFHKSAVILFPFYFISKLDFTRIRWIPWVVYIIALILSVTHLYEQFVDNNFAILAEFFGYEESYDAEAALTYLQFDKTQSTGLGRLVIEATTILILALIPRTKNFYCTKEFIVLFNLFLIGEFGSTAFRGSILLARPFGYFTLYRELIITYIVYFLFKEKKGANNIYGWLIIFLLVIKFIAVIYRGEMNFAAYHFFWEFV